MPWCGYRLVGGGLSLRQTMAARLVATVSESRSVEVAGVAHMIQLEAPARLSEELRDFIQDHPR